MIGLDTNLLLRFIVKDNPEQTQIARKAIYGCTPTEPGYINRVVLCECVWVLERTYKMQRAQIAEALEVILQTADLQVESECEAAFALEAYRNGADFPDALIAASNISAGCTGTLTLDRRAAKRAGMMLAE